MRFLRNDSYRSGIIASVAFNVAAKGAAFVTSLALAFYFGTHAQADLYFYILGLAGMLSGFYANLTGAVVLPEAMRRLQLGGREFSNFANFFFYGYAATLALILLPVLLWPGKLFALGSRFTPDFLASHSGMLALGAFLAFFMTLCGYLSDIFTCRKYFTMPMAVSIMTNFFILASVVIFHSRLGIASAMVGITAGYAINAALLLLLMKMLLGWEFSPARPALSRKLFTDSVYTQSGSFTAMISSYVPAYLLSGLNAGTLSALNYGRQVADLPNSGVTGQFSSVAGIKFNELAALRDDEGTSRVFLSSTGALLFAVVPASVGAFYFAPVIIQFLFGHGKFDASAVRLSSDFLRCFILTQPLNALITLGSRIFMAGQKIKQGFWFQIAYNAVITAVTVIFISNFGGLGYPLAILASQAMGIFANIFMFRAYFPHVRYRLAIWLLVKNCAAFAALFAPSALLDVFVLKGAPPAARLAVGSVVYALLIFWGNRRFRLNPDIHETLKNFLSRFQ